MSDHRGQSGLFASARHFRIDLEQTSPRAGVGIPNPLALKHPGHLHALVNAFALRKKRWIVARRASAEAVDCIGWVDNKPGRSIAAGLVGGEAFSVDASLIKADVDKTKRIPGDQPFAWPKAEEASHAVREYLVALDAARGDADHGGDDAGSSEGGYRRKPPKEVSLTDPQANFFLMMLTT